MGLEELQRNWEQFARDDPKWAILTIPGTRGGRWETEQFFASGREEIARTMAYLSDLGWTPRRGGRALDFGCGIGRLTQALAEHFHQVDGVDVAPTMVEQARAHNRFADRVAYHLNIAADLTLFPDAVFDLVYCAYVLQHVPTELAHGYVVEFIRLLAPGGVAVLQVPVAHRPAPPPHDPLPAAAFAGRHELLATPPNRLRPNERVFLPVRVVNNSPVPWPTRGERLVWVGARWFGQDGSVAGAEARGRPARDELAPGADTVVDLELRAPSQPGSYRLRIDLLQEFVGWFADHDGQPTEVAVTVAGVPADGDEPMMEMHLLPTDTVAGWVTAAGGRVLDVAAVLAAGSDVFGSEYEGATLVVTRSAGDTRSLAGPAAERSVR